MLIPLIKNLRTNWSKSLINEIDLSYFCKLDEIVSKAYQEQKVFPNKESIFNAFNFFNIEETKVVILGQDPYHDDNQANGLSFGINPGVKFPPSLKNIALELKNDLNVNLLDYSLMSWAKQNVLLLNTNLTVLAHRPLSHANIGWQNLVTHQLENLIKVKPNTIFVAWGQHAKKMILPLNPKFLVSSAHPSPFSVLGFFGSKPFSKINQYLLATKQTVIKW